MVGERFAGVPQELSRERGFAHSRQGEEFGEADGFAEVGVDEADGFGDGLLVAG